MDTSKAYHVLHCWSFSPFTVESYLEDTVLVLIWLMLLIRGNFFVNGKVKKTCFTKKFLKFVFISLFSDNFSNFERRAGLPLESLMLIICSKYVFYE